MFTHHIAHKASMAAALSSVDVRARERKGEQLQAFCYSEPSTILKVLKVKERSNLNFYETKKCIDKQT